MNWRWAAALTTAATDLLTTHIGLQRGISEGNFIAAYTLQQWGFGGLIGLKIASLLFAAIVWLLVEREQRPIIPLTLAAVWGIVTVVNTVTILS